MAALLTLAACSEAQPSPAPTTGPASTTSTLPSPTTTAPAASVEDPADAAYEHLVETLEYRPDLEVDIHALPGTGERPVVVTIHGGGWYAGNRISLGPLADSLAARDVVAVNVSYRTGSRGGGFPATFDDVACAVGFAAEAASPYTTTPDDIVIVGHSAGAHLGAVAWLSDIFGDGCPTVEPDRFVGLAGPYDTDLLAFVLEPFFGTDPDEDPGPWDAGNPYTHLESRPPGEALIVHGDADEVVALSFSEEFAGALIDAGHEVELVVLSGVDHRAVAGPLVVADLIADFARGG